MKLIITQPENSSNLDSVCGVKYPFFSVHKIADSYQMMLYQHLVLGRGLEHQSETVCIPLKYGSKTLVLIKHHKRKTVRLPLKSRTNLLGRGLEHQSETVCIPLKYGSKTLVLIKHHKRETVRLPLKPRTSLLGIDAEQQ